MLRQLGLVFAALAFFSIAGGHWAVLQTVAWAGMLRDYARQTGSVTAAVEQTFDGQHPCALCRQIVAAKQQEKAKDHPASPGGGKTPKAEKSAEATVTNVSSFQKERRFVNFSEDHPAMDALLTRTDRPPTPPPRQGIEA